MRLPRRYRPLLAVMLAVAACAKPDGRLPVYPVKGGVFCDGRPAAGAVVSLHPLTAWPAGTPLPRAPVAADGSFTLTTYVTGDGAPAGEYAVAVRWTQPTEYAEQEGPDLLPPRVADPARSGLKAVVGPGSNELPAFRLTRKP